MTPSDCGSVRDPVAERRRDGPWVSARPQRSWSARVNHSCEVLSPHVASARVCPVAARGDLVVFAVSSACPTARCARHAMESSRTAQPLGATLASPANATSTGLSTTRPGRSSPRSPDPRRDPQAGTHPDQRTATRRRSVGPPPRAAVRLAAMTATPCANVQRREAIRAPIGRARRNWRSALRSEVRSDRSARNRYGRADKSDSPPKRS
jgi:hypothetical protein